MEAVKDKPRAEAIWFRNDPQFRRLLEVVPAAAYTTDAEGLIIAASLWASSPTGFDLRLKRAYRRVALLLTASGMEVFRTQGSALAALWHRRSTTAMYPEVI